MAQYLVFQLRGDLSAWGDIAVGEQRSTLPFPTKSAVLGLIAAALGIRRDEETRHEELATSIRYGVKVFHAHTRLAGYNNEFFSSKATYSGGYMRDYHTVQSPSETDIRAFLKVHGHRPASRYDEIQALKLGNSEGTILSYREYNLDAYYIVGLCLTTSNSISFEQLQEALQKPQFHLYLGRKACPLSAPLYPQLVIASSIKEAIHSADFKRELLKELFPDLPSATFYLEPDESNTKKSGQRVEEYRSVPKSRTRWQFDTQLMHVLPDEGEDQ